MHSMIRALVFALLPLTLIACSSSDDGSSNQPVVVSQNDGTADVADNTTFDSDNDGFSDATDNCPLVANLNQTDSNGNGIGDACDETGDATTPADDPDFTTVDSDADGVIDTTDNCPLVTNPDQVDTDGNGTGDACDDSTDLDASASLDTDNDGLSDSVEINLGLDPTNADTDGDGINDSDDPFPKDSSILDTDSDGIFDSDEVNLGLDPENADTDGDGIIDGDDAYPKDSSILDTDNDGLFDSHEVNLGLDPENADSDGDGINDGDDPFPNGSSEEDTDNTPTTVDTDNDGLSDSDEVEIGLDPTNADTDNDGVNDGDDPFPNDASASIDSDNDGVSDNRDEFPNDATETSDLNGDGLGDNADPFDGTVISGVVVDAENQTLVVNGTVSLDLVNTGSGTNPLVVTRTNADGEYALIAEESLLPDSFVVVVTSDGFEPAAIALVNSSDTINAQNIELEALSDSFITVETAPTVHHLGDDTFSGSENSQFQRTTEGVSLVRNFNVTEALSSADTLDLIWIAKGIQINNTISINGSLVATTSNTNSDGSFEVQSVALDVAGVLTVGSNTLEIVSTELNTLDDFEFVLLGLQAP